MSAITSLEKSRNPLETVGGVGPLFMLRCDRVPVMLNLLIAIITRMASYLLVAACGRTNDELFENTRWTLHQSRRRALCGDPAWRSYVGFRFSYVRSSTVEINSWRVAA